jgi:hypothetical protein
MRHRHQRRDSGRRFELHTAKQQLNRGKDAGLAVDPCSLGPARAPQAAGLSPIERTQA